LNSLFVQVKNIQKDIEHYAITNEYDRRLSSIELKLTNYEKQVQSLQQIISPNNVSEILTVAKMKEEILARTVFETKINEKVNIYFEKLIRSIKISIQ